VTSAYFHARGDCSFAQDEKFKKKSKRKKEQSEITKGPMRPITLCIEARKLSASLYMCLRSHSVSEATFTDYDKVKHSTCW